MNESYCPDKCCKACNVAVLYNSHCPLCGRFIRQTESAERYPEASDRTARAKKIMRFIFILSGIVLLFLDFIIPHFMGWSFIGCAALSFIWFTIFKPIFDSRPFGLFVMYDVFLLCLTTLIIDIYAGYTAWSISYVWPAAIIAGITVILFSSVIGKLKWSVVGTPLVVLTVLAVGMLIAGVAGLFDYHRLWFITVLYSAVTFFALKYFLRRAFSEEIGRLFHF